MERRRCDCPGNKASLIADLRHEQVKNFDNLAKILEILAWLMHQDRMGGQRHKQNSGGRYPKDGEPIGGGLRRDSRFDLQMHVEIRPGPQCFQHFVGNANQILAQSGRSIKATVARQLGGNIKIEGEDRHDRSRIGGENGGHRRMYAHDRADGTRSFVHVSSG